jgi:hypothetical protein
MDSILLTLFHKLYAELYSQLSAVFDRKSYEGAKQESPSELMSLITKEMIEVLKQIELWDLIDFSDVASIARNEINREYSTEEDDSALNESGKVLTGMLDHLETLVAEFIPDIAHTFLEKQSFRGILDHISEDEFDLCKQLRELVKNGKDKSNEWKAEALEWIKELEEKTNELPSVPEKLMAFIRYVHEKIGEGVLARSIAHKVATEAESRESIYKKELEKWQQLCDEIESENKKIREQIEKRKKLVEQATKQFESEMKEYESLSDEAKGEPPEPLAKRISKINSDYPHDLKEKPIPSRPERSEELVQYLKLRDLLSDRMVDLEQNQEKTINLFLSRLQKLESESQTVTESTAIDLGPFLDYLMNYEIRRLARLLPRATRAYFRNPKDPDLVYLASYEHENEQLTVKVGSNFLRRVTS